MFGFLNIHKPHGMTSRRVVDRVVRLIGSKKVGHAGTLDPMATGVLVIGIGRATRLMEMIQAMPKHYTAKFLLGCTSPTEDMEGDLTYLVDPPTPTLDEVVHAATLWTGSIEQRPPAYSALKVKGRRAYALAREGETFDLAPRPITIHALAIVDYEYPQLTMDIVCSSGTYVRSLGRDLAESLGTGAVMNGLARTAIGDFRLEDAVALDHLTTNNVADHLLLARQAVTGLPQVILTDDEADDIVHGRSIEHAGFSGSDTQLVAAIAPDGDLLALLFQCPGNRLAPKRVFPR